MWRDYQLHSPTLTRTRTRTYISRLYSLDTHEYNALTILASFVVSQRVLGGNG